MPRVRRLVAAVVLLLVATAAAPVAAGGATVSTARARAEFERLVVDAGQAGGGAVTLRSPQAALTKQGLEQLVTANASLTATVDCGPAPFVVRRPGQTVTCAAAGDVVVTSVS